MERICNGYATETVRLCHGVYGSFSESRDQQLLHLKILGFCSDRSSFYARTSRNNVISEALRVFSSEFYHQLLILSIKHSALQPAFHPDRFLLLCTFPFLHNLQLEISCSWNIASSSSSNIMACFFIDIMMQNENSFIYLGHLYGYKRSNRDRSWQNRNITVENP